MACHIINLFYWVVEGLHHCKPDKYKIKLQLLNQQVREAKPCTPLSDNLCAIPLFRQTFINIQCIRWIAYACKRWFVGHHNQDGKVEFFKNLLSHWVLRPLIPGHCTELDQNITLFLYSYRYNKRQIRVLYIEANILQYCIHPIMKKANILVWYIANHVIHCDVKNFGQIEFTDNGQVIKVLQNVPRFRLRRPIVDCFKTITESCRIMK